MVWPSCVYVWQCARLVRRIEHMESLPALPKQQLHDQPLPADIVQLLQQQVNTQKRLRDALADNDRYRVAIDWLQHDFHLTFAAFRVQELMLQQDELRKATVAGQRIDLWTEPPTSDEHHNQLQTLYAQLQHNLHQHRVKLLGVGLYYKDRNMTQALEWDEADDLDAQLFSLLKSSEEVGRGQAARAVRAEEVCLSVVLISLAMHRARDEIQQLQEENTSLTDQLQQVVDDETWYVRSELQNETERLAELDGELRHCTSVVMSPFIAAVTAYWQQLPEVNHSSTQRAHTNRTTLLLKPALCVCVYVCVCVLTAAVTVVCDAGVG